jgi:predicted nucleotidyltransferase
MQKTKKAIIKKTILNQAKQYIAACNEMNIPVRKAILFGSQVNGKATKYSDIDLLIVSSRFKNNSLENWRLLSPVTARFYRVEPHPYPVKNFISGDPFIDEIKKYGVEITI